MDRLALERRQAWIYLAAIALGLLAGSTWPRAGGYFEALIWPFLVLLLYVTFTQVPLLHVRDALRDRRFVATVLIGNFLLVPALAWGLLQLVPADPAIRLGVLLVLLVPCTDWFIAFTQLGQGDVPRAIAATPLNLVLQLLLLPLYLWIILGPGLAATMSPPDVLPALAVVLVPLAAAIASERWFESRPGRARARDRLAWLPIPLLAVVVLLVAGAQVHAVGEVVHLLPVLVPVFAAYLVVASLLARGLARVARLPVEQGRTLAFSMGTRNSFVVLPVALALPGGEIVAVVIVTQSLVELLGMVFYLWWVPRVLFAGRPERARG
ncbi:arsenic resistance protein [Hoyosella sp. G463]|uniref:Arsenic resistance protein n=1 Tax=Lolliginicoccus lacisalsi TaxID=2742202 RepID=A0A927JA24_9ACTN|nr:arsenic resistance protein [Lolliginicoccus lacisalsi]